MRTVEEIDADIAAHEAKLRTLHDERRAVGRSRNADIVADFDGGKDIAEISGARRLGYSIVQGVLHRHGRTQSGRAALQRKLAAVGPGARA